MNSAVATNGMQEGAVREGVRYREILSLCVMGVAVLGGIAFRWLDLGRWSLWWDEGYTAWAASLSFPNVFRFARSDDHPPLYYLAQHFWTRIFGNSEFALRALSALAGTLALIVLYKLARRVLKDRIATALAVWLFAFSMKQIWYSREARAYELASFFALIALYSMVVFLEKRQAWSFAAIILCSAVTVYLHTMMFFYVLALNVAWLIYPSEQRFVHRVKDIFFADFLVGMLYLPWALTLLTQVRAIGKDLWWLPRPRLSNIVWTLRDMAGFEMAYLMAFAKKFWPFASGPLWVGLWAGVVVLCGLMVAGGFWRVSGQWRRAYVALFSYCLVPIFVAFVLGQKMPLYVDRAFTASSIVVPVLFALPLTAQSSRRRRIAYSALGIVLAGATALSAFGFLKYSERAAKSSEDWRGVTLRLIQNPETNRLIVFTPPPSEMLFDYYCQRFSFSTSEISRLALPMSFYSKFPPPKSKPLESGDLTRLESALELQKPAEVDLVSTHDVDSEGLIDGTLRREFSPVDDYSDAATVHIVRFVRASKQN